MGKAVDGRPVDEVVDGELVILSCELVRRVADPSRPWEQQLPVATSARVTVGVDGLEQVGARPSHLEQVGALLGDDGLTVTFPDLEKPTGAAQRRGGCRGHPGYRSATGLLDTRGVHWFRIGSSP